MVAQQLIHSRAAYTLVSLSSISQCMRGVCASSCLARPSVSNPSLPPVQHRPHSITTVSRYLGNPLPQIHISKVGPSPQPPNLTTSPLPTTTHFVPHPLSLHHPCTSSLPKILLFNHLTLHPLLSSGASCALIHVPTLPSSACNNSKPPGAPRTTLPPKQEGLRSWEKAWMRAVRGRADCGRRWDVR